MSETNEEGTFKVRVRNTEGSNVLWDDVVSIYYGKHYTRLEHKDGSETRYPDRNVVFIRQFPRRKDD